MFPAYLFPFSNPEGQEKAILKTQKIPDMQKLMMPVLFAMTKLGNVKWYAIEIHHHKGHSEVHRIKASKIGGKSQVDIDMIEEGVNIGKSNETTIPQQAEAVGQSIYNGCLDRGYKTKEDMGLIIEGESWRINKLTQFNTDASGNVKPMLANDYYDGYDDYPCTGQPKYNGVRCLALRKEKSVDLLSRKGKRYYNQNLCNQLMKLMKPGEVFDGELYCHGLSLQKIVSIVKKEVSVHPDINKISYVLYDYPCNKPWKDRLHKLAEMKVSLFDPKMEGLVMKSQWVDLDNLSQVKQYHKRITALKYEGIMLRSLEGMYEYGFRSNHLLKYKDRVTAEFKIVDVEEASGRDAGTAVFVCKSPKGADKETFNARPMGEHDVRAKYWKERKKLIGKMLTVEFESYSDGGVPIQPVGVVIRNYE